MLRQPNRPFVLSFSHNNVRPLVTAPPVQVTECTSARIDPAAHLKPFKVRADDPSTQCLFSNRHPTPSPSREPA